MHILWKDHISSIHNPAQGMPAQKICLIQQITELQEDYKTICSHISHHFLISSSQLPFISISQLVIWLHMHELVIQKVVKLQKHANIWLPNSFPHHPINLHTFIHSSLPHHHFFPTISTSHIQLIHLHHSSHYSWMSSGSSYRPMIFCKS